MLESIGSLVLNNAATFAATLLGVFLAFSLDRFVDARIRRRSRRAILDERRQIEGLLADSLSWNLNILANVIHGLATGRQGRDELARIRLSSWEANASRLMEICEDPQEKTDFAIFFEEIRRLRDLSLRTGEETVGGSRPNTRTYLQAINLALDIGTSRVRKHGTQAQAEFAAGSYDALKKELREKAYLMVQDRLL
jgi:hypothetical protein